MLALEHSRRQQFADQVYDLDQSMQAPYPGLTMDAYDSVDLMVGFHLPYSFFENSSMFATAPIQSIKQDMHQVHDLPPALISSVSAPSIPSASPSTVGSPYSGPSHAISSQDGYDHSGGAPYGLGVMPTIVKHEHFSQDMMGATMESELSKLPDSYVDPSLIHTRSYGETTFPEPALFRPNMHSFSTLSPSSSPAPSPQPYGAYGATHFSDPITNANYYQQQQQQQQPLMSRRPSLASYVSGVSHSSPASELDEEGRDKGRCLYPDCGKVFKDLKAHMLTHQAERPEKCPILTCEYNQKGFARKYDKNRHTLTHYKGTMVCGFCPGSGSPAEKSFNRADVFKRHLTTVHGVEQAPPNSRKRSPASNNRKLSSYCQDATGKCSTCSITFNNAQDFYEHLDDCVLRVVQQEEPSEAINAQHLTAMDSDDKFQETLDRQTIKTEDASVSFDEEEDDDDEEDDEDDEDEDPSFNSRSGKGSLKSNKATGSSRAVIGAGVSKSKPSKKGMTWSNGGVALAGKGRKKRKHYPSPWGLPADEVKMKKRVLCVFEGERRLLKDEMMMYNEFEVRMPLPDGKNYVTDLDVETLNRANAIHNATEEEKGPWPSPTEDDLQAFDLTKWHD